MLVPKKRELTNDELADLKEQRGRNLDALVHVAGKEVSNEQEKSDGT